MTLVFYAYVSLLARAAFREQGAATLETARALGRSRTRAFFQVTLPMARPSLAAGVSLAMMEALGDFGTVATFGYRTLTEGVYRVWYAMFDRTAGAQLASLLLVFALSLLILETMKEMPATLLLRPLGVNALAVAVWERTSESLWADAAAPSLAIVIAGVVPVLVVIRLSAKGY
jgi:iron(III) transport system permease protein